MHETEQFLKTNKHYTITVLCRGKDHYIQYFNS